MNQLNEINNDEMNHLNFQLRSLMKIENQNFLILIFIKDKIINLKMEINKYLSFEQIHYIEEIQMMIIYIDINVKIYDIDVKKF